MKLPEPPDFFPVSNEKFSFRIGLTKPGNMFDIASDSKIFLIDKEFNKYRANKIAAREELHDKYVLTELMEEKTESIVSECIIKYLLKDQSEYFSLKKRDNGYIFSSALTSETLLFDKQFRLCNSRSRNDSPAYNNSFDALACQVQDDLVVVQVDESGQDKITAIHLCAPNHWSAQEKYGKDFASTHENVPDFNHISQQSEKMLQSLIHKDPYVRFAWGLSTDIELNHYPAPPENRDTSANSGRSFNMEFPELYMRIERQVILGIPEINGFLFTIRTYFRDIQKTTNKNQLHNLINSIESMEQATAIYKGIYKQRNEILTWLNSRTTQKL